MPLIIPFHQGYQHLLYNPDLQVLGIVTGEGKSHAAASIMGLGMDRRFDFSKAYWIVAAIAGVDPNKASVASTAWAKYVVDGDLSYQIDAREIRQAGLRDMSLWVVRVLINRPINRSIPMVFNRFTSSIAPSLTGLSS